MLEYALEDLIRIEESIDDSTIRTDVLKKLRQMGLSDFGLVLLSIPNPRFPKLSGLLPKMASEEVQLNWTGSSGIPLLTQSLDFVRSLSYNYTRLTGKSLGDCNILDYGCGYGRIIRLLYYLTDESNVFGVDPWDKSIEICHSDGLTQNIRLSDYLPTDLPFEHASFDLIFAFSVFTHLSKNATLICLNLLANHIKPDGVIAITIRPIEFWDTDARAGELNAIENQKHLHRQDGFSFLPHNRDSGHNLNASNTNVIYGDTSMTISWLARMFDNLEVVGLDRSLSDPTQLYVFLQKRP